MQYCPRCQFNRIPVEVVTASEGVKIRSFQCPDCGFYLYATREMDGKRIRKPKIKRVIAQISAIV